MERDVCYYNIISLFGDRRKFNVMGSVVKEFMEKDSLLDETIYHAKSLKAIL